MFLAHRPGKSSNTNQTNETTQTRFKLLLLEYVIFMDKECSVFVDSASMEINIAWWLIVLHLKQSTGLVYKAWSNFYSGLTNRIRMAFNFLLLINGLDNSFICNRKSKKQFFFFLIDMTVIQRLRLIPKVEKKGKKRNPRKRRKKRRNQRLKR